MRRSQRPERKGPGKGCGITVLVLLALSAALAIVYSLSIGKAKQTEQTLNERLGEAPSFVPRADGSIPADRIEAFLRVREQVREHCAVFQEKFGILDRLDQLEQDESVPRTVVARESVGGLKAMLTIGPAFLRFMEARNQALLAEEMGLGEYIYIYALAYSDQLRGVSDSPFADVEQAHVGNRARRELTQILQNQLNALETAEVLSAREELASGLRDQIARLGSGRQALPWETGLPPAVAASLEPYAELLTESYCEGIAKIELMQKNKGLDVKN